MEKKGYKITYGYDELNRLTRVALNGKVQSYYSYDPAGNLVAVSPTLPEKNKGKLPDGEPAVGPGAGDHSEPVIMKTDVPASVSGDPAAQVKSFAASGNREEPAPKQTQFVVLQEEYDSLNDLAQSGAISLEEFQEKVNALRLQDAAGIWWQLRSDGAWLKCDGANWTEAKPDN